MIRPLMMTFIPIWALMSIGILLIEPIRNILKVFVWGFGLIAYWHAVQFWNSFRGDDCDPTFS